MHGHHGHAHDHHDHAHHHPAPSDKRYTIAIALNLGFVIVEAAAGFMANSTALLSDATHNLSDVLGLTLAGGAAWLAKQQAGSQRTYGFSKATVLAALANALVLVVACGGLLWEASTRLFAPEPTQPLFIMAVAAAGVVINGATAMLFLAGRKEDVNVRGAYLHMMADPRAQLRWCCSSFGAHGGSCGRHLISRSTRRLPTSMSARSANI